MELLEKVSQIGPPARDPHRILWWRQPWMKKDGEEVVPKF